MLDHAIGPSVITAAHRGHAAVHGEDTAGTRSRTSAASAATGSLCTRRFDGRTARQYHGGHDAEGYAAEGVRRPGLRPLMPPGRPVAASPDVRRLASFVETDRGRPASPLWNPDLAPTRALAADVVHLPHRRALDRHERGHHHLHARVGPHAAGDDVVGGARHHPARQRARAVPMILNAHAGTKYGVSFPVLCRASFGVRGANVPAMLRAIVACGWFGIQTWIGALALDALHRRRLAWLAQRAGRNLDLLCDVLADPGGDHRQRARGHQGCSRAGRRRCCSAAARCCCGGRRDQRRRPRARALGIRAPAAAATRRSGRCSRRRSPPTSATGPRSASTFPTSRATRRASDRRCSARRWACRRR